MSGLWAGVVAEAPTTAGVMVLLPQLDGGYERHGPCAFQPRPDGVQPQRGDRCLVVEDDRGGLWVWWVTGAELAELRWEPR